jgi:uncharacterized protein
MVIFNGDGGYSVLYLKLWGRLTQLHILTTKEATMVKAKWILLVFLIFCATAHAADTKTSEQSIKELLRVMETRKLLDSTMGQVDSIMKASMQQAFKGQIITPKQQKLIDDMQNKIIAILKQEMNWEMLEPLCAQIYRDSFTQQEVDGMLAFYKSPSGKAVIKKMPLVMQNTLTAMQERMRPIVQKMRKMEEEAIAEMKADAAKE